ncbi:protein kinase [Eubacteriaceae bacterium ES2]|nr:protein kinase [Eubacteriaceae bacterium ES2]
MVAKIKGILALYGYESPIFVGNGRFGTCYSTKKNNREYLFKVFKKNLVKRRKNRVLNEGRVLMQLCHPGIPEFIETIDCDGILGFVMEKKVGLCLSDVEDKGINLTKDQVMDIVGDLIELLVFLETKNIRHRDIQLSNLIWKPQQLSLIDFGSACQIDRFTTAFEPDFWALGDTMIRLFSICDTYYNTEKNNFYNLSLSEELVIFLKSLFYIERPFNSFKEIRTSYRNCCNR